MSRDRGAGYVVRVAGYGLRVFRFGISDFGLNRSNWRDGGCGFEQIECNKLIRMQRNKLKNLFDLKII